MTTRRNPGAVRDAILDYLAERRPSPAPIPDIVDGVRAKLGDDVPASSVRSYLNLNAEPKGSRAFTRTAYGMYKLAHK